VRDERSFLCGYPGEAGGYSTRNAVPEFPGERELRTAENGVLVVKFFLMN
jgi:hypothetical protein